MKFIIKIYHFSDEKLEKIALQLKKTKIKNAQSCHQIVIVKHLTEL
jgi:hypothetical protein